MASAARLTTLAFLILNAATAAPTIARAAESPRPVSTAAPAPSPGTSTRLELRAGDIAPDFDIATTPYGWRRFSDLWKAGEIVLVFEPDERALVAIEREARPLAERGVSLTVVRTGSDGDNWDALARLGLSYDLLSDPSGYIAELYGLSSDRSSRVDPAWCMVDRGGVVRHMSAGVETEALATEIGNYVRGARAMAEGSAPR